MLSADETNWPKKYCDLLAMDTLQELLLPESLFMDTEVCENNYGKEFKFPNDVICSGGFHKDSCRVSLKYYFMLLLFLK